jgi:Zn-dependent oligopeptidase
MLRQLYFSTMDLELHRRKPPGGVYTEEWVVSVQREVASKYQIQQPLPDDAFLCSFSHIFAGGYSAGYYSYKVRDNNASTTYSPLLPIEILICLAILFLLAVGRGYERRCLWCISRGRPQ